MDEPSVNSASSQRLDARILLLAGEGFSSRVVAAALQREFGDINVIIEEGRPLRKMLRSRIRMFGWVRGPGQILFRLLVPLLKRLKRRRIDELQSCFDPWQDFRKPLVKRVTSVNATATHDLLRDLKPDLVVINGTRILSKKTLLCAAAFVNMHLGITPKYRGVHGGYWAMTQNDGDDFGTTIHFVDPGVDTGKVLAQGRTKPTHHDSLVTYPLLQLEIGVPLMIECVDRYFELGRDQLDESADIEVSGESKQWYHPTAWEYLWNGITKGVW